MTLVLLPGLDGTGELFRPLWHELPVGWSVITHSYPADPRLGYDELTEHAWAALPTDGPLVLLGESFSGPVAIRLAARLGDRVDALILCCTFASNPRPVLGWLRPWVDWLPAPSRLPAGLPSLALLGTSAPASARSRFEDVLARLPAALVRARLKMVMQVDVCTELAAVRAPVLYLQARDDRLVPRNAGRQIVETRPGTKLVSLPGPHALLQVAPRPAAAAMAAFLGEVRRSEPSPPEGARRRLASQ